ncbi:MAG: response regulator [Saccharospirillaceae bacterium]|nr:response regulator [Pseudomonadales bacterium]NRB77434.1 response regulator [Saccharospirillaceae bacterium]
MFDFLNPFNSYTQLKGLLDYEKSKQIMALFILQMLFWFNILAFPMSIYQDFVINSTIFNSISSCILQVAYLFGCYQAFNGKWKGVFVIPLTIIGLLAVLSQVLDGPNSAMIILYVLLIVLVQMMYSLKVTAAAFVLSFISYIIANAINSDQLIVMLNYHPNAEFHDYAAFFCCLIILVVMAFFVHQHSFLTRELMRSKRRLENEVVKTSNAKQELAQLNINLEKRIVLSTQKLTIALNEAEEANKAKSDFLAKMSHEMRTPLNGILGFGELLTQDIETDEKIEYTAGIIQSGVHLLKIVNDILDIAKIENENLSLENENFELKNTLLQTLQTVKGYALDKQIELNFINVKSSYHLYGDQQKFKQILVNLLSNAIKFSDKGKVGLIVKEYKQIDNVIWIEVKVQDEGIGFDQNDVERMFEPFQQQDNSIKRRFGGTGLGLSIVKSYLELLGGTIKVKSLQEKGSEFLIRVPFEKSLPQLKLVDKTILDEIELSQLRLKKVLVVEDNIVNLKVVNGYLKKMGINSESAENGQEALNRIQDNNYDLIFMDCHMPVIDGYDATRKIRELVIDQPYIIALTANAMENDKQKCLESGMNSFLAKPLQRKSLHNVLKQYLELSV